MGTYYYVESLKIVQCGNFLSYYGNRIMDVSVSNDGTTFGNTVTITATGVSSLQTLSVGLGGRYLKVYCRTWASFSIGADYIAPYGRPGIIIFLNIYDNFNYNYNNNNNYY